jgi:hypothetical protein
MVARLVCGDRLCRGVYTAVKVPLLILLTCASNALLNGMIAQLLGLKLRFRDTASLILTSFAILSVLLAGMSPITFFLALNAPPYGTSGEAMSHSIMQLTHVSIIAYAGVIANYRLYKLLLPVAVNRNTARAALASWVGANLFLGAQISWVLRPFIGNPGLPVQFLRENPLRGNFYEEVAHALQRVIRAVLQ